MGINIVSMGSYVPEQSVTNDDLAKFVDTNDEWIRTRTGIVSRHISAWEPTWYMGAEACKKAVEKAGINPDEIGLIICCTITNDFHTPSVASIIQNEIKAFNAMAFDLNAACTGYIYAMDTARRFLETEENMKYALVVASENLSRITDFTDRGTCILFGDGASASIIEKSDKLYSSYLASDGSGARLLFARCINRKEEFADSTQFDDGFADPKMHGLVQNGKEVYKFATKALPKALECAAEKINMTAGDIDVIVPHQANLRIIETAAKNMKVSMDKIVVTLDHNGNTSSASVPLAFDEALENCRIKRGDKVCMVGFGAGLTYGAIIIEY